jgi:Mn-dependent DtxR family transcriptional regulator
MRQVRGRVVAGLREAGTATVAELAAACDIDPKRVTSAVEALAAEGLITARDSSISVDTSVSID